MELVEVVGDFLRSRRGKAENTIDWYRRQLRTWLKWLDNIGVTTTDDVDWLLPETLEDFLDCERERGVSDSTVAARYRSLAALFNWVHRRRRKWLDGHDAPTSLIDRPDSGDHQPRIADIDDVQRLIRSILPDEWLDYRDRLILQTMLSTGLRVEEVVNLKVDNIDLRDDFVFVEAGKGDKPRIVPFDGAFRLAFVAYTLNRPAATTSRLLLAANAHHIALDEGMSTDAVRHMLRRRCKAANVRYMNPHSIRHLFATKALNDGVKLSAVSAMMGHTSPSFTARVYAKWVKAGLRREYDENWKK
ncbi:MAG: tyrosine-type recombinase/integrase [Caldilineaceae bacterium]